MPYPPTLSYTLVNAAGVMVNVSPPAAAPARVMVPAPGAVAWVFKQNELNVIGVGPDGNAPPV